SLRRSVRNKLPINSARNGGFRGAGDMIGLSFTDALK
ncbi:MAG: hypothetical protein ACI82H_001427, partial [Alphaproteobacteria bacterium]